MYLNEILPGNWREDEWPEHIEVSHESSRLKCRINPSNCPEYISCEDYHEQEEFYE